jgi:hypothetical protein
MNIEIEDEDEVVVEVDLSDLVSHCDACLKPLTELEEPLGYCEDCAWEIASWTPTS